MNKKNSPPLLTKEPVVITNMDDVQQWKATYLSLIPAVDLIRKCYNELSTVTKDSFSQGTLVKIYKDPAFIQDVVDKIESHYGTKDFVLYMAKVEKLYQAIDAFKGIIKLDKNQHSNIDGRPFGKDDLLHPSNYHFDGDRLVWSGQYEMYVKYYFREYIICED
ncbi:hypothetical protein H8S90_21285 [Olivibacter sp. SDN3]|uniref:hypothetical protein n=1 Tax=Olivibacter sp. SDN3 TaxID=2764720 RepID=UPI00165159B1|nr:hypothetical protein [Olivibacter sp. SDN3]QNL49246.1 hypothetical protein H8S90_21285 [Olivibacter sp. SDN3]